MAYLDLRTIFQTKYILYLICLHDLRRARGVGVHFQGPTSQSGRLARLLTAYTNQSGQGD
jgi:hypothetical protein